MWNTNRPVCVTLTSNTGLQTFGADVKKLKIFDHLIIAREI